MFGFAGYESEDTMPLTHSMGLRWDDLTDARKKLSLVVVSSLADAGFWVRSASRRI